jgi:hypothetical protein
MNPIIIISVYFFMICSNIILLFRLYLPSAIFPSDLTTKTLYAFLLFVVHATFLVHSILLGLIILITLGEEYKL